VIEVVVQLTMTAWLVLEAGLLIRDRVRGKGSAAQDQGTLWLNIVIITVAVAGAGLLRHPSTGIVLLMAGLGLVYGNVPALAILLVVPAGVLIHRIFVEEAVLTEMIGGAYADYAARTKRLVPGLW
jgi:protein-S-isoprenylcysteine O-methyltransferase Ste14